MRAAIAVFVFITAAGCSIEFAPTKTHGEQGILSFSYSSCLLGCPLDRPMATEAVETIRLATGDARLQDAVGVRFSPVGVLDVVELAPGEPGALARDVHVVAVAPGTAVIEVVGDGGEVLDWTVMSVAVPDAIELRFDEGGRERATGAAGGEIELAVGARKSIFAAVLDDAGQMLMTGNTIDGSIMTWTIDDAGAVDVFTIGPVAIVDTVAAGDGLVAAETPNGLRVALDVRVW